MRYIRIKSSGGCTMSFRMDKVTIQDLLEMHLEGSVVVGYYDL